MSLANPWHSSLMSHNISNSNILLSILSKLGPVLAHLVIILEQPLVVKCGQDYGSHCFTVTVEVGHVISRHSPVQIDYFLRAYVDD